MGEIAQLSGGRGVGRGLRASTEPL